MRLIDADNFKEYTSSAAIRNGTDAGRKIANLLIEVIDELPTVEAKEVVHGKWIGNTCSACCLNWDENMVNNADDWGYFEPMPNFCPNCGADMRKKV